MRIKVTLQIERETTIPLNYQYALSSAVYGFLANSDTDYAQFLHSEGYAPDGQDRRRFKLFTFSLLRAENSRIETRGPGEPKLHLRPGTVEWKIASPVEPFLNNFASGLLAAGVLRITNAALPIAAVETEAAPQWSEIMRFKCLSPIVAAVTDEVGGKLYTRFLRAKDPTWSERLKSNLLVKYSALHGTMPEDPHFRLEWDAKYLAGARHEGTKKITFKSSEIVGVFVPFTMQCSHNLFDIVYNAGIGEKNAAGFGMIEISK